VRLRRFATLDIDHVRLPQGLSIQAAIAAFRSTPGVLVAQPNYVRRVIQQSPPPNDPFWLDGSLWGLKKIQAQSAWTGFTAGDGSVVIASIDTGVDYTHPDLAANMWRNPFEVPGNGIDDDGNGYVDDVHGIDTVNHDSNPIDDQGHGTHTSGTIAAVGNNNEGVAGVNWNAKILACKFLSSGGSGTDAGAIECFDYIVALRNRGVNIRVSSNSWGAARGTEPPSALLQAAIDAAGAAGIINIFGAGNDGTNNDNMPFDPASYDSPSIVAVASSGATDRRSFFSNYGASSVDLAAPGENILSTFPGGWYEYSSGTSMATPHVAGVAALLAKLDPSLSAEAMKAILLENVDKSSKWNGKVASGGRLNAFRAASAVGPGTPNEPPSASLTSPVEGATFKAPVNITLEAVAADGDGHIQHVAFYANGFPIGTDTTSPYGVTWVNAAPGTYALTAVATDDGWATGTSAPVNVTVLANEPPSVQITSPAEGASFASPATLTIEAAAADSDGFVEQVVFYANGTPIGTDTSSPYSVSWEAPIGSYVLKAMATDNAGATALSAVVNVTVTPIPGRINVALTSSGGAATASSMYNANYPPSGTINGDRKGLKWGQGGGWNDGTPNASPDWLEVTFNGLKIIEEINVFSMQDNYSSPIEPTPALTFSYWGLRAFEVQYWDGAAWVTVPGGAVVNNNLVWRKVVFVPVTTTRMRVFITGALNGYSRMIEAEAWGISSGGNAPPDVEITAPASGATFTAPAAITVSANANDLDGSVASVAFFANGAPIGTDTTSPHSITWNDVAQGTYVLTSVATDNEGAETTSSPVSVTVAASNTPPSVAITSPAEGATFTAPASIALAADAFDTDGSVASVAFFANGSPIGSDTAGPFEVAWTNVQAGSYAVTAVATDNQGAATTSAAVHIMVDQPAGRMNVALAMNGGVATASSTLNANYPASGAINGDRRGLGWGAGGGWNDGTPNSSPDWIEVAFTGPMTIDEINVFSMQDNYTAPIEPTQTMTFAYWGLRAFEVQYWTGSAWAAVPGGTITNNNRVWRQVLFAPVTTTRVRVFITGALNGYSRAIEVEAWGADAVAPDGIEPEAATSSAADRPRGSRR
jgi:subtilisin family serine protease